MSSHAHPTASTPSAERRLTIALALAATYLVVEVIGGLWSGSLALLADAGHMLTDVAGLGLALAAAQSGARAVTRGSAPRVSAHQERPIGQSV